MTRRNFSNLMSGRDFKMTKIIKTNFFLATVFAICSTVYGINIASAQEIPPAKIIVIDSTLIGTNAAVATDLTRQVTQIQNQLQADLKTREDLLRAENDDLKTKINIMPQEAYNLLQQEFQVKVNEYQQDVQIQNRQIEVMVTNAYAEIERALIPIRLNILQLTGATMMMDKSFALVQVPGLDVTTRVIEQLDIAMPSINVELPPVPEGVAPRVGEQAN